MTHEDISIFIVSLLHPDIISVFVPQLGLRASGGTGVLPEPSGGPGPHPGLSRGPAQYGCRLGQRL